MDGKSDDTLQLDPALRERLLALAEKTDKSVAEVADEALRSYVEQQERLGQEYAEDEARWQRYLAGGKVVSFEIVRRKLHSLAAGAAREVDRS